MRARGFTLMEAMLASSLGLVVLAGTLTVGVQLQRKAIFERQTSMVQGGTQAMADLLGPLVQRAGEGMGNARISLGGTASAYAVQATTRDAFAGFPGFSLPPDAYADRASDSLQIRWADPTALVRLTACNLSGADGGTGAFSRDGQGVCTVSLASAFDAGTPVYFVNPDLSEACSHLTSGPANTGTPNVHAPYLPTQAYPTASEPPAGDGCAMGGALWATPGTVVMPSGGATFRVNWASGAPVLEWTQRAPPLPGDTWTELSRDVEQMTVAFGVRDLTPDAGNPLSWYPAADGGTLAVDKCAGVLSPTTSCPVPGGMGPPALDPTVADALMRRARAVEIRLVARAARRDSSGEMDPDGGGYTLDPEGNPEDGFTRRTLVMTVAPRNFQIAGSF
jgi:type IV pilus assembly protein PilW